MIRRAAIALMLVAQSGQADPSLECSVGSGSQVEIAECLATVEEAANAALEVMVKIARENAEELDKITEREVATPALEASQSAWEAFRDLQCDYAGALFGGGSGTGIAIRSCRIELTRARTSALDDSLN